MSEGPGQNSHAQKDQRTKQPRSRRLEDETELVRMFRGQNGLSKVPEEKNGPCTKPREQKGPVQRGLRTKRPLRCSDLIPVLVG